LETERHERNVRGAEPFQVRKYVWSRALASIERDGPDARGGLPAAVGGRSGRRGALLAGNGHENARQHNEGCGHPNYHSHATTQTISRQGNRIKNCATIFSPPGSVKARLDATFHSTCSDEDSPCITYGDTEN
jgi:hypothetical protein